MAIRSSTQSPYNKQSPAVNASSGPLQAKDASSRNNLHWTVRLAAWVVSHLRAPQLLAIDIIGLALASFLALAFRFNAEDLSRMRGRADGCDRLRSHC